MARGRAIAVRRAVAAAVPPVPARPARAEEPEAAAGPAATRPGPDDPLLGVGPGDHRVPPVTQQGGPFGRVSVGPLVALVKNVPRVPTLQASGPRAGRATPAAAEIATQLHRTAATNHEVAAKRSHAQLRVQALVRSVPTAAAVARAGPGRTRDLRVMRSVPTAAAVARAAPGRTRDLRVMRSVPTAAAVARAGPGRTRDLRVMRSVPTAAAVARAGPGPTRDLRVMRSVPTAAAVARAAPGPTRVPRVMRSVPTAAAVARAGPGPTRDLPVMRSVLTAAAVARAGPGPTRDLRVMRSVPTAAAEAADADLIARPRAPAGLGTIPGAPIAALQDPGVGRSRRIAAVIGASHHATRTIPVEERVTTANPGRFHRACIRRRTSRLLPPTST